MHTYITLSNFGGTAPYQHQSTGENITEQRYFRESTPHYELIGKIGYQTNTLVTSPKSILHSLFVDPNKGSISDVETSRLTFNMFIAFF